MLSSIIQGNQSVNEYFTELNVVLEALGNFRHLPYCSCDNCNQACFEKFVEMNQKDWVNYTGKYKIWEFSHLRYKRLKKFI